MAHKLESKINYLVQNYLSDYNGGKDVDRVEQYEHPDKKVVIEIIEKLRKLIFPGYFQNESYRVYTVRNNTTMLLEDVI